jgi:hypothetical protein
MRPRLDRQSHAGVSKIVGSRAFPMFMAAPVFPGDREVPQAPPLLLLGARIAGGNCDN